MESAINLHYSSSSLLVLGVLLLLTTVIPVKLGASLIGAENTTLVSSAFAVFFGVIATAACFYAFPGFAGLLASYVAISVVYWLVLRPSFLGAFLLTFLIVAIQLAVVQGLYKFGLLIAA